MSISGDQMVFTSVRCMLVQYHISLHHILRNRNITDHMTNNQIKPHKNTACRHALIEYFIKIIYSISVVLHLNTCHFHFLNHIILSQDITSRRVAKLYG